MELFIESNNIRDYLKCSKIINYNEDSIQDLASQLKKGTENKIELINKVYNYVRDNIAHSGDINGNVVTCTAAEVLKYKEGICFAKSHLLAALLRYLEIPTGFCYQILILDDETKPYLVLHGLNAVYIEELQKWVRVDARGNKEGVNAKFSTEREQLAFSIREEFDEVDILKVFKNPDTNVIDALTKYKTREELLDNLPSVQSVLVNEI